MLIRAVFDDGSYIEGRRSFLRRFQETPGTHHIEVTEVAISRGGKVLIDPSLLELLSDTIISKSKLKDAVNKNPPKLVVAIPISKPKYWIIGK